MGRAELRLAIRAEDQERRLLLALHHVLQEEQRRFVRPVQVFEDEEDRGGPACGGEERSDRLEQPIALTIRIAAERGRQPRHALEELG